MLEINIHNVESLVFENDEIWKDLPHLINLRNQWKLGIMMPVFRPTAKKSLLDFINKVTKEDIKILSKKLNDDIVIIRLNYNIIRNYEFDIENLENNLNLLKNEFFNYFIISRKNNSIGVTFWR